MILNKAKILLSLLPISVIAIIPFALNNKIENNNPVEQVANIQNLQAEQTYGFTMPANLNSNEQIQCGSNEASMNYSYSEHHVWGTFKPIFSLTFSQDNINFFKNNDGGTLNLNQLANWDCDIPNDGNNQLQFHEKGWGASHSDSQGRWVDSGYRKNSRTEWEMGYDAWTQPFFVINFHMTWHVNLNPDQINIYRNDNQIFIRSNSDSGAWCFWCYNTDKSGDGWQNIGWSNNSGVPNATIYDYGNSYYDQLQQAFDINKILTIDETRTKRWVDTSNNKDTCHVAIGCNSDYLLSCLGNWQTQYWTTSNNWVNLVTIPDEVKTWLNSRTDVITLLNTNFLSGKIWDSSIAKVNNYQFPNSQTSIFTDDVYNTTGTYAEPNTNNSYSLANLLIYAYANKDSSNLITLLTNKISTTTLSWINVTTTHGYSFNFNFNENYLADDHKLTDAIKSFANDGTFTNNNITLNYTYYHGATAGGDDASSYATGSQTHKLTEWINGISLPAQADSTSVYTWEDIRIANSTNSNSWNPWYNTGNAFNIDQINGRSEIAHMKEIDAIDCDDGIIYQGQSTLKDINGQDVAWTNDLFREFINDCKFFTASNLVSMLTAGSIWWSIEEKLIQNSDSSSRPDFSQTNTDDFLKSIDNDGFTFLQSYTNWFNTAPLDKWLYGSNLTEDEFEKDLKNIETPITITGDHTAGKLTLIVKHHKFFNANNPSGEIITDTFEIDGFKPYTPPPNPPSPINSPISWGLIGGLTAGGAVLFGSFGVWLIYRRHRGKRSLFNKKKIKTKEKQPESMDDLRKEMRKKAEEDKVYE